MFKNVLEKELQQERLLQGAAHPSKVDKMSTKSKVATHLFEDEPTTAIVMSNNSMQKQRVATTSVMGVDGINLIVHAADVGDSGDDIELLGEISGEEGGESDEEHEWEQDGESGTDVSDSGLDNDETLAQPIRGVDEVNQCTAAMNKVSEPPAPEHKSADSRSIQEKLDQDKIVSLKNDPKIKLLFKEMLSELGGKSLVNHSIHKDRPKTMTLVKIIQR